MDSISVAQQLGFRPVNVNAVIIHDLNDHEIEALAEFACERSLSLRFIRFMPLDPARAWLKDVVWHKEARHRIGEPEFVAMPRSMSCMGG